MTMMVEELIATVSSKKEVRSTAAKGSNNNAKIIRNTALLEALAKGGYVTSHTTEDGKVKIKILVKKQDLKQLLDTMDKNNTSKNYFNPTTLLTSSPPPPPSSFEMRLYELMKKKRASQAKERHPSYWKPALQSIPEEH